MAPASDAQLNHPQAVAVTANGGVLIADTNNQVVRKVETVG
jgi:NHL repeat